MVSELEVSSALVVMGEGSDDSSWCTELTSFALGAYALVSSFHDVGLSSLYACEHGNADLADHCVDGTRTEVDADC